MPVLFGGRVRSVAQTSAFMEQAYGEPSVLGGEREGVVLRLARGFPAAGFQDSVCQSVRTGHVQGDGHWARWWKPCRIVRQTGSSRPPVVRGDTDATTSKLGGLDRERAAADATVGRFLEKPEHGA